jgi:RimJ/RimL family protein N-acetyltransferase
MSAIKFRNPEELDASLILEWRNAPEVRAISKNTAVIKEFQHLIWFRERITRAEKEPFWILEMGNVPIGFVRLDLVNNQVFEISILLDQNHRGTGLGKKLLCTSIEKLLNQHRVTAIESIIHSSNKNSIRLFEKTGFRKIKSRGDFLVYHLLPSDFKTLQM